VSHKILITVAHGDSIGPEIMAASLHIMLRTFDGQQGFTLTQGQ
jgi:isocitrate/isopropylmalate dehydrogenase